jgi:general secretion pathway protein D
MKVKNIVQHKQPATRFGIGAIASWLDRTSQSSAVAFTLAATLGFSSSAMAQAPGSRPASTAAPASQPSAAPSSGAATLTPRGDEVTLNFRDAEIESVVAAFGHLLGRNLVVDPRVRGKMTLETARPVSRQQAFELFRISLRGLGFAFVDTNGVGRILPEADAKLQASQVAGPGASASGGEQVVTQVFRLSHETAANLVPVLRPLIAPNNTVVAYPGNNSLVVTDYASNVARIAKIIESIDTPVANEVEVIPMVHALAVDVAVAVNRLLDESARGGQPGGQPAAGDSSQRVTVLADTRLNSVMVRTSSPERMKLARSLISRLDVATSEPGNIHVVYLRNAEAVKLAQTLRGVLVGEAGAGTTFGSSLASANQPGTLSGSSLGAGPGGSSSMSATGSSSLGASQPLGSSQQQGLQPTSVRAGGAVITADPASNALIITAPESIYRSLRSVIDKLDSRRAQVFIESLIVEVQADKAAELGIQWQFLGSPEGSTRGFGGTNFGGSGVNIVGVTSAPSSIAAGLNIGIVRGTAKVGNTEVINLGLLARALESDASANILATPNLLTLDNEEARIIIGQNVPFITGQFTSPASAGAATVNPFQTIERRDVGTTLRVRPQISESGTVRLQIFQEVSSVQDKTNTSGIITNRRAIESTVLVDDGEIIVLGGLIEETISGSEQRVPGLGDLPIVGGLFRYEGRKRVKNNLLVFLRPVVLRDAEASGSVTASRYDYIRALRMDSRIAERGLLPEMRGNPLPAIPEPQQSGAPRTPAAVRQPGFSLSPDVVPGARPTRPFASEPAPPTPSDTGGS